MINFERCASITEISCEKGYGQYEEENRLLFPFWGQPNYSESKKYDSGFPVRGEIRFENVMAKYKQNQPNILKGINITFEAGKTVGILGRTGSPKTKGI